MKTQKTISKTTKPMIAKKVGTKKQVVKKYNTVKSTTVPKTNYVNNFYASHSWPFPLI